MRRSICHPGQKVITTEGRIEIVAFMLFDAVFVYQSNGNFRMIEVVGDCWGGELDQEQGLT